MKAIELPPMPEALARRPRWKGLLIPYVQFVDDDGVPDFRITDVNKTLECSKQRLCGLCGETLLPGLAVFIGGPMSALALSYTEPPYHPACVLAAMKMCPFIVAPKTKRAAPGKLETRAELMAEPPGWMDTKPDEWVLVYCRSWLTELIGDPTTGRATGFTNRPEPIKQRRFRYDADGELKEETP